MSNQKNTYIFQTFLVVAIILAVNLVGNFFNGFIDLTEDKRFTLSDSTLDFIENVDDIIYVKVLLEGEFPAGFKRLRNAAMNRLDQFASANPLLEYTFEDPMDGPVEDIRAKQQLYKEMGMAPTNLTINDGDERTQKIIYPYALVNYGSRQTIVNLLEPQGARGQEEVLNTSINLLEFKLANAIQKLTREELPNIVISTGHGETPEFLTARLEQVLKPYYDTGRLNLDSLFQLRPEDVDLLLVPAPKTQVPVKTQFLIDQYLMSGGKILWLIENFEVNLDSIDRNKLYVPKPIDHNLNDLLFKYGARVKNNLILDLECAPIPQVIGAQGEKPQTILVPWYYHPLAASKTNHPIVKGIDRVKFSFPSTVEILERPNIEGEVLLSSSEYSRFQVYPMRLTFEILRIDPDPKQFNKGPQPIAVLLDGEFESFFKNRITQANEAVLQQIGSSFKETSPRTQQIIVSDVDFLKNKYDPNSERISPIGFSDWEKKVYEGNQAFIVNSVEFLLDDFGLLEARGKDFKLRLLDKVKTSEEQVKWQVINLVLPIFVVWAFALLFFLWRKRKYAH